MPRSGIGLLDRPSNNDCRCCLAADGWGLKAHSLFSIPVRRLRRGVGWKRFERHFLRPRRSFLVRVSHRLRERSLENVIGFVAGFLPFTTLNGAFEFVSDAVDDLGRERKRVSVQLPGLEELIEEGAFVAIEIAKP